MRAILICHQDTVRAELETVLKGMERVSLCRTLSEYPTPEALGRILRTWGPAIVFMDINHHSAEAANTFIRMEFSEVRRVAIDTREDNDVLRKILLWEMHELITPPFNRVDAVLDNLARNLESQPTPPSRLGRVVAFTPAKAGVGASTLVANTAWSLADQPESQVLLADFDSHSGVTSFLFGVDHDYALHDALALSRNMDEDSWRRIVRRSGKVDLLLSAPNRLVEGDEAKHVAPLVEFIRRNYNVACADIPDRWDGSSMAVMREADQILLVTTPELPSLRLARQKVTLLRKLDLEDKTLLLVNRLSKKSELTKEEIENTVGMEVLGTFGCDYNNVTKSIRSASPAACLQTDIQDLTRKLFGKKEAPSRRARFIEKFAMVPARFGFR